MRKSRQIASADVAVITPISVEWNSVCSRLSGAQESPGTLPTKRGRIGEYDVVCVKSGKGQKNTAASLQLVMREWGPRWVLLVGIAGGFRQCGVKRGDVVVAKFVYDL